MDKITIAQWARSMWQLFESPPPRECMFVAINEVLEAHGLPITKSDGEHWTVVYN